jgi:hypothetical protein
LIFQFPEKIPEIIKNDKKKQKKQTTKNLIKKINSRFSFELIARVHRQASSTAAESISFWTVLAA